MEDFFDNNVCSICKHKGKNGCSKCMLLETHKDKEGVFYYRCLNYEKKPTPKTGEWKIQGFFINRIIGGNEFGKVKIYYDGKAIYEEKLSKDSYCT